MRQNGDFYAHQHILQGSPVNTTFVESIDRREVGSTFVIATTGVEHSTAIALQFGDIVSNITFITGATAAASPTAGYACVRDGDGALLAQTADFGSTARASNTAFTVALATPLLVTRPGLYYVGISFTASTVPTLRGADLGVTAVSGALGIGAAVLARTHGSSVGATAPAATVSPTTVATMPYYALT